MKRTIVAFALPLLLALAPTAASAARILWISIDPEAVVVDEQGAELGKVNTYKFQASDKAINAAKVSVEGANGSSASTYVWFVYQDEQDRTVVDDRNYTTIDLRADDSGSGGGSGSETIAGAEWLAAYLGNIDNGATVILELGHVDWAAVTEAYENNPDPATVTIEFERMAISAPTMLSALEAQGFLSTMAATTATPSQNPWSPTEFTAVPEPSVCGTALLGVLLLAKRRKSRRPSAA